MVRRLLMASRSPLMLALVPLLLVSLPQIYVGILGLVVDLSFDAFNKGFMPIQETIIVVGFCIALVRSKPSISGTRGVG
jgi:hypothetical protein